MCVMHCAHTHTQTLTVCMFLLLTLRITTAAHTHTNTLCDARSPKTVPTDAVVAAKKQGSQGV